MGRSSINIYKWGMSTVMFDFRRIPEAPEPVTDEDVAAEEVSFGKRNAMITGFTKTNG